MQLAVVLAVFPVIFIGELPDKTMFASLLLATRGRPLAVWAGAAAAFVVHVVIAVTVGVALFHLLPARAVDAVVAALFAFGAVYALIESRAEAEVALAQRPPHHQAVTTAFVVVFLAEWGDLTQVLMANLAAHYHAPLSVAVGALLALWCVAAIAVIGGSTLLRHLNIAVVRRVTAAVLICLSAWAAWSAAR
ncbi:MAG TPA: TMEM165/GDT1 family protein [Acidimicrobiales bacterium]|nr:TMEM165/GDT1 family protein [Acidimicrobiales bacterium]